MHQDGLQKDLVISPVRHLSAYMLSLSSAIILWLYLVWSQPVAVLAWPDGTMRTVWFSGTVYALRYLLTGLALALPVVPGLLARKVARAHVGPRWSWMRMSWPLGLVAPGVLPLLWPDLFPPLLASNMLVFFPALALSLTILNVADGATVVRPCWLSRGWSAVFIVVMTTLLFMFVGIHLSEEVGPHAGDEAHYFTMAESLWEDGDLDLQNNIAARETRLRPRNRYHISRRSRDDHWYSQHPFGLSIVLAPAVPGGLTARHAVLGLIAGLGCGALFLLCGTIGASAKGTAVVCSAFVLSSFWAIYAARCLPETLGATLTLWAFWAMLSQERRGWTTAVLAGLCLGYLPWVHVRFAPHALVGVGLYALFSLFVRERVPRRLGRWALLAGIFALSLAGYIAVQRLLFSGSGAYSKSRIFAWPDGLLYHLSDGQNGLIIGFPAALWILAAQVPLLLRGGRRALVTGAALALLLAMYIPCATSGGYGAATHPGRYFLAVLPLLVPGAALVWSGAQRFNRWWFLFLASISFFYLVFILLCGTHGTHWHWSHKFTMLSSPFLVNLLNPFHVDWVGPALFSPANYGAIAWLVLAFGLTVFLHVPALAKRPVVCSALVGGLFLAGGTAHRVARTPRALAALAPADIKRVLARNLRDVRVQPATPDAQRVSVFDVTSVRLSLPSFTNDPERFSERSDHINQPQIPVNDWAGRAFRWATLWGPVPLGRGDKLLHVTGRVRDGDGPGPKVVLAVRQGSRTVYEGSLEITDDGRVDFAVAFRSAPSWGHMLLLLRMEDGVATFSEGELALAPYSATYAEQTGLVTPVNVHLAEAGVAVQAPGAGRLPE